MHRALGRLTSIQHESAHGVVGSSRCVLVEVWSQAREPGAAEASLINPKECPITQVADTRHHLAMIASTADVNGDVAPWTLRPPVRP